MCATILDLALWSFLITSKKRERLLLLLSGAMGILFAGEAIGDSLRNLATPNHITWLSRVGSMTIIAANFTFLYIWWAAFRQEVPEHRKTKPRAA
jgi:hypothetical protein